MNLHYQTGFGNEFATEAKPGSLPIGRNSPQVVAHGLYAEQLSGTAFTAPRHSNLRTWLYRIRPSAMHENFSLHAETRFHNHFNEAPVDPNQLRWSPMPSPKNDCDFIDSLFAMCGNGGAAGQSGVGIHR